MADPFEVITRGVDSSGRPVQNTAINWQRIDEVNALLGGKLVIVQGAFRGSAGADASAGTHNLAGCNDFRTWNLTTAERVLAQTELRDRAGTGWYRTPAQGFDEHMHDLFLYDYPLHPDAEGQKKQYLAGYNGLASWGVDDFARPNPIPTSYEFQPEDDMADYATQLDRIEEKISRANDALRRDESRDAAERVRDRDFMADVAERDAALLDQTGQILNMLKDDATPNTVEVRRLLREDRQLLLTRLQDNPATTAKTAPSADALKET